MHGEVMIRGQKSDVGLNQSEAVDLIDDLSSAFVLHGEVGFGDWSLFADLCYMELEFTQSTRLGNAELDFTQSFFEAGAIYDALHENLGEGLSLRVQPLVGVRVYYFDAELTPAVLPEQSGSESWVDGFGGFRFRAGDEDGLALIGRFDIGGGGSDLAWNAIAGVDWQIAGFLALTAGYRWLSVDYGNGSGTSRTEYDLLLLGPFIGVSFRF